MFKNIASQKWTVFAFQGEGGANPGAAVTGDAANITANLRLDGGAANAVDDTNPTELEDGYYVFDITQAESNADMILMAPESGTSNVIVIGVPGVIYTTNNIGLAGAGLTAINLPNQTMDIVGDITGNLSGSVGSVTGAVGSVAGNVAGNVDGSVGSNVELGPAEVNTQVDLALSDINLDHFVGTASGIPALPAGTYLDLLQDDGTATYSRTTDSLQAIRDHATTIKSETVLIVADTDELQGDWVDAGRLDLILDARMAEASIDTTAGAIDNVTLVATTTTNTDVRGTDSAALASVCTEVRLSELDEATAGKMANQVDIIQVDTTTDIPALIAALNDISVADILTTQMTEAFAADGVAPTLAQALFMIQQILGDFGIAGTTLTVRKIDGVTTAATFTLDDDTNPTDLTRAT